MKLTNLDERIHVLDNTSNVMTVIRDIATSGVQEEAFYVLDIGDIVQKHQIWKEKLPRVDPYYAVKCNDSLTVLEVLAALGTGFDCASKVSFYSINDFIFQQNSYFNKNVSFFCRPKSTKSSA